MKKFMALYRAPVEEMQKIMATMTTPEAKQAEMEEWSKWGEMHKANLVDMGNPLGKTKIVTAGEVADGKNDIGGYTIVQAETHEEAAKLFLDLNGHLKIPGASIEVMEIVSMM